MKKQEIEIMSTKRLSFLKSNRPAVITGIRIENGKVDISKAIVKYNKHADIFNIQHLTKKGYASKKPLILDFLTFDKIERPTKKSNMIIVLSEKELNFLIQNYNVKPKIWKSKHQLETEWVEKCIKQDNIEGRTHFIKV